MKKTLKKLVPLAMIVTILFSSFGIASSAAQTDVDSAKAIVSKIADWQVKNAPVDVSSTEIDGNIDWVAFASARNDLTKNVNYLTYINGVVEENFTKLSLTDFARITLAVGASGGDARAIGGRDLISGISSADLNLQTYTAGISYSLIALQSKDYGNQQVKDELLQILLSAQRTDGGFNYLIKIDPSDTYSTAGDVDSTAMVLQAIAPYSKDAKVAGVITKAIAFVKAGQKDTGGFGGAWGDSADTTAQALTALCELGINPLSDEYIKSGKTILDAIKAYQSEDGGIKGFDGKSNVISSYQMLYALNAYIRYAGNSIGLFNFNDVTTTEKPTSQENTASTVENSLEQTDNSSSQKNLKIVIGVGAGLLICVALAIVIKHKKKNV